MKSTLIMIVVNASTLQDGLLALMTTIPRIGVVLVAEDQSSAMRMVDDHRPGLIVLDLDLFGKNTQALTARLSAQSPPGQTIALVDDSEQKEQAKAAGIDNVLLKGFSATEFIAAIEEVLRRDD
jgi:DNA-binding NarL/FixJ family response regulator